MVPGFMQLLQDDQIALLKSGSYGIMLLYATQYYIPERNCFLFNQQLFNPDLFLVRLKESHFHQHHNHQQQLKLEEEEINFIKENFEFVRQLKQFNLSDTELAILSALILFNPDNRDLIDQKCVYHFHQRFVDILRMDIENNRIQTQSPLLKQQMLQQLLNLISVNLKKLTISHFEIIKAFKIKFPKIEFPPLHRELFNVDYYIYYQQQQQQQQIQQIKLESDIFMNTIIKDEPSAVSATVIHENSKIKCESSSISPSSSCSSSSSSSVSVISTSSSPSPKISGLVNIKSANTALVLNTKDLCLSPSSSFGGVDDFNKKSNALPILGGVTSFTASSSSMSNLHTNGHHHSHHPNQVNSYIENLDPYNQHEDSSITKLNLNADNGDLVTPKNSNSTYSSYLKSDQFFSNTQNVLPIGIE